MSPLVGIIDYRTGNSRSFSYALDRVKVPNRLVVTPRDAEGVTHFVLPGVGAAGVTMDSLAEQGWVSYLNDVVVGQGVPFLGVCVGLQVLFDHSSEGDVECLGWLPGTVEKFDSRALTVPHMGWNSVSASGTAANSQVFETMFGEGGYVYFVNSYFARPADERTVLGVTDYGEPFASVVGRDNILATQFHVEKSGQTGLAVLRQFVTSMGVGGLNVD